MLVIACSFRSFLGGSNDAIQRAFIDSLRNQSSPYHLIAVQFGESNVECELKGIKHSLVNIDGPWGHSKVLSTAISTFPNHNIVHTSVDVVLPEEFSRVVGDALVDYDFCTSWPYSTQGSIESKLSMARNSLCLDLIGFSSRITGKVQNLANSYPNIGWGLTEHLFVNFAFYSAGKKKGINLNKSLQISRYLTPHLELDEQNFKLRDQWRKNKARWEPWLSVYPHRRAWISIFWVLLKFKKTPLLLRVWLLAGFVKQVILKLMTRN